MTWSRKDTWLFEISAETCFKMGGIHTVIHSKIPYMKERWGDRYFLMGPYIPFASYDDIFCETDEWEKAPEVTQAVEWLRRKGIEVHSGFCKTKGRPAVILINPFSTAAGYEPYKSAYLERYGLRMPKDDESPELYIKFGFFLELFFIELARCMSARQSIIAHFHEYMTTVALPAIKRSGIHTVFTAHATVLGRSLALKDGLHKHLSKINWRKAGDKLSEYHRFCLGIERIAASTCHVMTSVSLLMADECRQFLSRIPDVITPNGLDVEHMQNRNSEKAGDFREALDQMVSHHFFERRQLPLKKLLYFFSSGRYEYVNKGYYMIVQALARLNTWMAKEAQVDIAVVMFFITDEPNSSGSLFWNKLRRFRDNVLTRFKPRRSDFFLAQVPEYFRDCRLVKDLNKYGLVNKDSDHVKVVYSPQFLSPENPHIKMEYLNFIRGCDLGIFPSQYEPWGYTPVECVVSSVPVVTTSASGFGQYIASHLDSDRDTGIFIVDRTKLDAVNDLFEIMKKIIAKPDGYSEALQQYGTLVDWNSFISLYDKAYMQVVNT